MHFCEFNLTLGLFLVKFGNLIRVRNNRAEGILGNYYQKFLEVKKKSLCILTEEDKVGEKLSNNSYDGAIGKIEKKMIDLLIKPESILVESDSVDFTHPTGQETYMIGHLLLKKRNENDEKNLFFNFFDFNYLKFALTTEFTFNAILLILIWFFGNRLLKNDKLKYKKPLSFVLETALKFKKFKNISLISTIIIFYGTFNSLNKQFISMAVKTNKVIVDTSEVLSNQEKIFEDRRTGERDFFLAANAPKNTFLNTLFESKNSNPPKFIDKENFFEEFNNMKNIFIFGSKNFLKMILNYLSNFMDENYYQNEKDLYSALNTFYRIKSKSLKSKLIDYITMLKTENGFIAKLSLDFESENYERKQSKFKIYNDLEEYINDNSKVDQITLKNIIYLYVFFAFANFIIILFFINHLITLLVFKCIKKKFNFKTWVKDLLFQILHFIHFVSLNFSLKKLKCLK